MPTAQLDGAEIYYEIMGHEGPWVAVISGGRHPLAELAGFARIVASRGHRVVAHDRRNCGRSSLDFGGIEPEDDVWAADLDALLDHLYATPAIVVGRSRGTRVAIRVALRHPRAARGLMLWGLSGGPVAARYLDDYYYLKYMRAAREGGMEAVCALDHFAGLITARPENRQLLLEMDPLRLIRAMRRWRVAFHVGMDRPVMGVGDEELRRIGIPTAIVPYYDRLHPHTAVAHAHRLIRDSRFFDFDPARRDAPTTGAEQESRDQASVAAILCDFESSLA